MIAAHPVPPRGKWYENCRNQQLSELAELAKQSENTILAGDFNCVPWSPYFRKLIDDSGLKDSRQGFGIHNSWHIGLPFGFLPIDHCLQDPSMTVTQRRIELDMGSDHRAIFLSIDY